MEDFRINHKLIGRTADGSRVYVDARFETVKRPTQTTDHDTLDSYQRLSLTGDVIGYRCREAHSVGQIQDTLDEITTPANGLEIEDIRELKRLWDACHLNDMNALCAHQHAVYEETTYGRRLALESIPVCAESGYRPGTAWLFRDVPEESLRRIREILR